MTGVGSHSKMGSADRWWLGIAVFFAVAGMLTGFWFSFWNLTDAARAHHWTTPYMLPLIIDSGIPVYVIIDQLIVRLGWKSHLPRLAAWGLAALTIALNGAAVKDASLLWRIVAAAMPALWVLGIEVLRLIWRALRKDSADRPDRIPAGRWLAAPWPTAKLWRRMTLLGVTSWPLMLALEDARVFLRDLVSAVGERYPDRKVPAAVRQAIRSGRFPGEVHERIKASLEYGGAAIWEPVLETWLSGRLRLPEAISDAISAPAPTALPAAAETHSPAAAEPASGRAARATAETTPRPRPKLTAKRSRSMSAAALEPWASDLLDEDPTVSLNQVIAELHVGRQKASEALRLARKNRMSSAVGAR